MINQSTVLLVICDKVNKVLCFEIGIELAKIYDSQLPSIAVMACGLDVGRELHAFCDKNSKSLD